MRQSNHRDEGRGPRVRTPLWNVVLPDDPIAAVFIVVCLCLFGSLCVVVRGTSQTPVAMFILVACILLLFFAVLVFHDRYATRSRAPRRAGADSTGTFPSHDSSAKIPPAAAERRSTRAPARPRPSPSAPRRTEERCRKAS